MTTNIGDRVEFHSQWPHRTDYGYVIKLAYGDEFGNRGPGAIIQWDDGSSSFVPFWNSRLRAA